MDAVIVDTNVIVIANDTNDKREDCRDRCQDRLQQIRDQGETVILDDGWRIFEEYERYVKPNTRKRDGDLFVKRLLQNLGNPDICKMVHITPLAGSITDFAEFPNDEEALVGFHKKDRKFIAVALAHQRDVGETLTILLAIDKGWLPFTAPLATHGVNVDLICEEDIQRPRQREREK